MPVVPVLGRCLLSRLQGLGLVSLCEDTTCGAACEVGACCPSIWSVPFVPVLGRYSSCHLRGWWLLSQCQISANFSVLDLAYGRCVSSGDMSALLPRCSSWYKVGGCFISDVDVPGIPHPVFQSDIVSTVH